MAVNPFFFLFSWSGSFNLGASFCFFSLFFFLLAQPEIVDWQPFTEIWKIVCCSLLIKSA
jgi:hypothetical protein